MSYYESFDNSFQTNLTETVIAGGELSEGQRAILKASIHPSICKRCGNAAFMIGLLNSKPAHQRSYNHSELVQREQTILDVCLAERQQRLQNRKHQKYELGAREFTLTYSPNWFTDEEARTKMRTAIERLIKYYRDELVELRAVGEVGSNGLSHVHCFYKLNGGVKITDKNFKRAWSHWNPKKVLQRGFEGGHHATVRNESDFKGYIDKDVDSAWFDITAPAPSDPI